MSIQFVFITNCFNLIIVTFIIQFTLKNMPFYHKLGKIPPKRHTQFRKADGSFILRTTLSGPLVLMGCLQIHTMSSDPPWLKKLEINIL